MNRVRSGTFNNLQPTRLRLSCTTLSDEMRRDRICMSIRGPGPGPGGRAGTAARVPYMVVVTVGCNVRSGRWWAPALSTHATPICPYKAASPPPPFYLALWSATPPPPGVVYGVIKLLLYSSLDNLVGVRLLFTLHRQSSRHA